jgi:hypothetical protein
MMDMENRLDFVENPMCFNCGALATMFLFKDLSREYAEKPDGILEAIEYVETHRPDRTPIRLSLYVCDVCEDAASEFLLDRFGASSGQRIIGDSTPPCVNPFHRGEGHGVPVGALGDWWALGCPDCADRLPLIRVTLDSISEHPAYLAMAEAFDKLSEHDTPSP